METTKNTRTKRWLVDAMNTAGRYLELFPNERSKFTLALSKQLAKYKKAASDYNQEIQEIRADLEAEHCAKDKDTQHFLETQVILKSGDVIFRKKFTKESDKAFRKAVDEAMEKVMDETIEVTPFEVDIPQNLPPSFVEPLTGFVLKEMSEDEYEKWYLAQKPQPAPPRPQPQNSVE